MNRAYAFCLIGLLAAHVTAAEPIAPDAKIAFLGIHLTDQSAEGAYNGTKPEEFARTEMLEGLVAARFADEGFDLMDLAPVTSELERVVNPARCDGCDIRMGQKLGADYVLAGEVYKISNLILSMNLALRETAKGQLVKGLAVDIRSNSDDSWQHGMRYILNNAIFNE